MLHFETVEPATLELLRKLQESTLLKDCRLVGGTSLALQIGHRKSVDLDFFGQVEDSPEEIKEELRQFGELQVRKNSGNIHLFVLSGIHITNKVFSSNSRYHSTVISVKTFTPHFENNHDFQ